MTPVVVVVLTDRASDKLYTECPLNTYPTSVTLTVK